MKKQLISAVLAAATALSLSATAFAAASTDKSHFEVPVDTLVTTPKIDITWPTTAGIVLNPYTMSITVTSSASGVTTKVDTTGKTGDDSTVISPELKFTSKSEAEVKITVTGSIAATTMYDDKGNRLTIQDTNDDGSLKFEADGKTKVMTDTNPDGTPVTKPSTKIKIATAPLKQPTWDATGTKLTPGDTYNSIFLYFEAAASTTGSSTSVTGVYSDKFATSNTNQMVLTSKDTSKELFRIPLNGTACAKVRGDVSTMPTVGWDKIVKTEEVNIKLIFDASPVAKLPEPPAVTTAP